MWSFFSRDPAKDFNYDIGETLDVTYGSIWSVHHGKKRGSGDPVTVFTFDLKQKNSETQFQIAKASLKRIKTLRHPNILTFLDGIETDKIIYFATEPVLPLEIHLNKDDGNRNELAISWGLHQIVKGLSFLVNDCNLIHNNVCMASVFVDQAGEWKLGGVDFMYTTQDSAPIKCIPMLDIYDPPEKTEMSKGARPTKWSADMWGLGCLVWEVFNGRLPKTSSLKSLGKIPKKLVPNYCELVSANPKSRPNPSKFMEECRKKGGFMNNSFVDTMLFLEEIQIKDQAEKTKFFTSLTPSLDSFPPEFCRHKILPQLLNAFEYGNAGSSVLAPLFKVGRLLDTDEYQRKIVPCVVKLFSSPDRVTRVKLLQQIESFIEHLQPSVVNDKIFPHIVSGFMDTNPMVRESTIKAMLHLASKLNYKNLNEELMKHFARLQAKDDQGGIRTNTTVCLGKIAGYLSPQVRQKILSSAFLRAMKDPFPPARQAGILAMAATQNLYSLREVSGRLLPTLCGMTMDPEKGVRDQCFKAIKGFLSKLEKVSENPELAEDMEKEVMMGGSGVANTASWAGWAVTGMSSLTSKIYNKATKKPAASVEAARMSGQGASQTQTTSSPAPVQSVITQEEEEEEEEENEGGAVMEGWDADDWGDMEDLPDDSKSGPTIDDDNDKAAKKSTNDWDDDDDDWGSLEDPGPKGGNKSGQDDFVTESSGLAPASTYNWGGGAETDDFFSSAMGTSKPSRPRQSTPQRSTPPRQSPARQMQTTAAPQGKAASSKFSAQASDGWGDDDKGWGDDGWDAFSTDDKAETSRRKRQEREEKRQQRQKEMQEKREARKGGGAMKLGAKKLASD